jgi:hypothetical protein
MSRQGPCTHLGAVTLALGKTSKYLGNDILTSCDRTALLWLVRVLSGVPQLLPSDPGFGNMLIGHLNRCSERYSCYLDSQQTGECGLLRVRVLIYVHFYHSYSLLLPN